MARMAAEMMIVVADVCDDMIREMDRRSESRADKINFHRPSKIVQKTRQHDTSFNANAMNTQDVTFATKKSLSNERFSPIHRRQSPNHAQPIDLTMMVAFLFN